MRLGNLVDAGYVFGRMAEWHVFKMGVSFPGELVIFCWAGGLFLNLIDNRIYDQQSI